MTSTAEQMDVHEGTSTVREAMRFSAYLRQPASVSEAEKNDYVEEMIELLELQDLADAMVFSLGVEARKRLTIGVELASKPELLLFLGEFAGSPTFQSPNAHRAHEQMNPALDWTLRAHGISCASCAN